MKKLLLSASIALLTTSGAYALVTDGITYEPVNGVYCTNSWIIDRTHNLDAWTASTIGKAGAKSRTAVTYDGVIYVGNSANDDPTIVDEKGAPIDCAGIEMFKVEDGSYIGKLKVTLDGTRISGLLCANQVGVDNFGNLWMAGYSASNASNYKVYSIDKVTGAATLQAELPRDMDGRIDYCDLVGDITRTEAKCIIMAPGASTAFVYRWLSEQGTSEWVGDWDGDNSIACTEFYPVDQTMWNTAPTVTIVLGEGADAYNAELFYIDGNSTAPSLYSNAGCAMQDNFGKAPDLAPELGTNGVAEFAIADKNFMAYSIHQYTGTFGGCNLNVCELGPGMAFEGMTKYWRLPENGMGMTSDTGTRVHSIGREYDDKGGVFLTTFKCSNGLGAYYITTNPGGVNDATIGSDATIKVNGTVITVSEEASEIAIFNTAGQLINKVNNATEIAAPAAGAYIVKATVAGNQIAEKVIL